MHLPYTYNMVSKEPNSKEETNQTEGRYTTSWYVKLLRILLSLLLFIMKENPFFLFVFFIFSFSLGNYCFPVFFVSCQASLSLSLFSSQHFFLRVHSLFIWFLVSFASSGVCILLFYSSFFLSLPPHLFSSLPKLISHETCS